MRTKKTVVILVSGLAGSGKNTVSEMLHVVLSNIDKNITTDLYSLAEPIKYMSRAFLGWNGEKDDSGRRLLQNLGKVGREYDIDIWVKHMFNQLDKRHTFPVNFVIVTDWRFPNEKEYIESNPMSEVYTVRVVGRKTSIANEELAKDVSEISLTDDGEYDAIIDNVSDLEALEKQVDILASAIQDKYIVE